MSAWRKAVPGARLPANFAQPTHPPGAATPGLPASAGPAAHPTMLHPP